MFLLFPYGMLKAQAVRPLDWRGSDVTHCNLDGHTHTRTPIHTRAHTHHARTPACADTWQVKPDGATIICQLGGYPRQTAVSTWQGVSTL